MGRERELHTCSYPFKGYVSHFFQESMGVTESPLDGLCVPFFP